MSGHDGLRVVVTGGASGIGAEVVKQLTSTGASVLAADLDTDGLATLARTTGCATATVDVADPAGNENLIDAAVDAFAGLDLVFLNAGVLDRRREELSDPFRVADLDMDRYDVVRGVLFDAVVHGTIAATRAMAPAGGGSIVATASAAGLVPWHPTPIYSAAKHAVVGWVRAIAPALERDGVRINAICPGGVATPLIGMTADAAETIDRLLAPAQVAEAMIATALDQGTGQAISVVAGRHPLAQVHDFNEIPGFP